MSRLNRPDWHKMMGEQAEPDDNQCVIVTRGTARLAMSALRDQNARDYYHNYAAAEREITAVLGRPVLTDRQKLANMTASLAECEGYCATKTSGAAECNCGSWYFRRKAG